MNRVHSAKQSSPLNTKPMQTRQGTPSNSVDIQPTVIAVSSGKGGVGKTNIAVNLAISLTKLGARVLCIDADLGLANMDIVMGVTPMLTTADILTGNAEIEDVLLEGPEGVWLLPGASGQYDLANLSDRQRMVLFSSIDKVEDRFDILVVDTGAGVGSNATGFAAAARDILLVVTPEPTSVADAYGMIKVLNIQCQVRKIQILVNMAKSALDAERVFQRLQSLTTRFLDAQLELVGFIPRDPLVARAVMRGQPFCVSHPDGPASRQMLALAESLATKPVSERIEGGAISLFWRKLLKQEKRG